MEHATKSWLLLLLVTVCVAISCISDVSEYRVYTDDCCNRKYQAVSKIMIHIQLGLGRRSSHDLDLLLFVGTTKNHLSYH